MLWMHRPEKFSGCSALMKESVHRTRLAEVVDLLWTNIVGPPTPADDLGQYSALIDNGTYTAAELTVAAADHNLNTTNIDLIGLSQTGLEFDLYV